MKKVQIKKDEKMPFVYKLLIVIEAGSIPYYLFHIDASSIWLGVTQVGVSAVLINITYLAVAAIQIYGILKRYIWAWQLYMITTVIGFASTIANLYMMTPDLNRTAVQIQAESYAFWTMMLLLVILTYFVYQKRAYLNRK